MQHFDFAPVSEQHIAPTAYPQQTELLPWPNQKHDNVSPTNKFNTKSFVAHSQKKKNSKYYSHVFSMLRSQEQKICQRYDQLMEAWEKKVERMENNPRRKAKESRTREYYERQFPEIRKQREQQERFQR